MSNKLIFVVLASTLLTACGSQPKFDKPATELPEAWASANSASQTSTAGEQWWTLFGDTTLNALVDETLQHNHDIATAAARVLEAQATLGVTDADRHPVITANGEASRKGISEVTATPLFGGMPRYQNDVHLTLNASYEADIWGKYRNASDAARAELLGAQSARNAVRLTMTAEVAQQYFNLLATDAQIAVLREALQSRSDSLALLRVRNQSGIGSDYEIRQAEAEEASAKSQLAGILKTQESLESALAILLGRSPREVMVGKLARGNVASMQTLWVPDGLPSELLLRRPDIQEAEQKLLAENARIAVARAEYFPSITLTAFLGSQSANFAKLFSGPAGIFQFVLGLSQPLFNAGRLDYSIKATEARREQAVSAYKKAVASAFGDVRNALIAQTTGRDMLEAETARVAALLETQRLANIRYNGGISSRLEVLDADRQLLQAKLAKIDAENAQRAAVVSLFKALGGGWTTQVSPVQ